MHRDLRLLALLPLTIACGDKNDDTDHSVVDTESPPRAVFTFEIDGALDDLALELLPMSPDAAVFESAEYSRVVDQARVELSLEIPAPETLVTFDLREPDLLGRCWMASLFHDVDGDAVFDSEDHYMGLARAVVIYLDGEPGEELAASGLRQGWNLRGFAVGQGIDYTDELDADAIPLTQNLAPVQALLLEGPFEIEANPAAVSVLVTAPETMGEGEVLHVVDQPVEVEGGRWSLLLQGEAPEEHRGIRQLDEDAAVEMAFAYLVGPSGEYEVGDTVVGRSCIGERPLLPVHIPAVGSPRTGLRYLAKELQPGWSLYLGDSDAQTMTHAAPEQASSAALSESCRRN
jgi:hypothetical protein